MSAAAPGTAADGLEIDWTRCDGHGVCAALLPEAVTRDDWGYPVIDDRAAAAVGTKALNRVVTGCPALALRRAEARPDDRPNDRPIGPLLAHPVVARRQPVDR